MFCAGRAFYVLHVPHALRATWCRLRPVSTEAACARRASVYVQRAATTVRSAPGVVYTSCERRRSCNLRDASLKRRGVFGLRPASRVCVLRLCSKSEEPHVSCECNEVFYVLRATRHLRLRSAFGAGSASCILRLAFCA